MVADVQCGLLAVAARSWSAASRGGTDSCDGFWRDVSDENVKTASQLALQISANRAFRVSRG